MLNGVWHYVEHWYTTNLFAAQKYQHIEVRLSTDQSDVFDSYDVTLASIVVTSSSADQLSVSVLAWTRTGKVSITAQYMADTNAVIESGLHGGLREPEIQEPSILALPRDGLSTAVVTGVPLGSRTFNCGQFRYIHTELYDPSLLS